MRLRGWPDGLGACMCCGTDRALAGYVAKGLCQTCYGRARKRGDLSRWSLPDQYRRPSDTVAIAARRRGNPTTRLVGTLGAQHVADWLSVSVQVVTGWHEHGTPAEIQPVMLGELERLEAEERHRAQMAARLKGDDWGTTGKRRHGRTGSRVPPQGGGGSG